MVHVLHSHPNLSGYKPSSSNDFEDTESDQNSWGDDSSDESSGNENGGWVYVEHSAECDIREKPEAHLALAGEMQCTWAKLLGTQHKVDPIGDVPNFNVCCFDSPPGTSSPEMTAQNSEKQLCSSASDHDGNPCSDQCYLRLKVAKDLPEGSAVNYLRRFGNRSSGEEGRTPGSPSAEETCDDSMHHEMGKRKVPKNTTELPENLTLVSDDIQEEWKVESREPDNNESLMSTKAQSESASDKFSYPLSVFLDKGLRTVPDVEQKALATVQNGLISRNLLSGLKTCIELSSDMFDDKAGMLRGAVGMPSSFSEDEET
ncbi:hypothetical protein Acr_21g0000170 [Actinidia rufa]|uniref:Uncharacterized protein n=1 Tax=Actinidia rufa TaxID=165716 RepID=A0A7J0GFC2_9ERIC|nr:hypothetical protein Acr_21g0000170 [Actinidia rufa]